MAEPSVEVFHGSTTGNLIKTYFVATRPAFFSASLLPILTALAYVWRDAGQLDIFLALTILISVACVHAAANVLNDYHDARNGTDGANTGRIFPFSGGSRFIQNGILSEQETQRYGLTLLVAGSLTGLIVLFSSGPLLWGIGLIGALLAYIYSAPPCLACRGLGDLTIVICFGLLPVSGTVYAMNGAIDSGAIWMGLGIGCFVAAILWVNSIPDIEADLMAGKRTLPSRLGARRATMLHGLWFGVGFGLLVMAPLGTAGWLSLIAVIPAILATGAVIKKRMIPAMPLTIITQALVCVLLALGFVLF
jgi:1,4-dihydroxy-2-naphthoate octaprenyltransferase